MRVWCLLGKKAGDNTQVCALATELGWGFEEKHIQARRWELLIHLGAVATLAGIKRKASSDLAPPWPDLVITAGRRNEAVAQWIRRQSGGHTRLVQMGRPWARLDRWDLIITTPQYFLPQRANVLHNSFPLHQLTSDQAAAAADKWRPRFEHLPRPWIAVLAGGDSGRFVLTQDKGTHLGHLASTLASGAGGSLLVTDSARTPVEAGHALEHATGVPNYSFRFKRRGSNPYQGILALADGFVVTGESMSMLAEAADTGRPLYIFDPGDGDTAWWKLSHNYRYKPLTFRLGMLLGPRRMRRDIGRIQGALVASGAAHWLNERSVWSGVQSPGQGAYSAREELARSAEAVRRLVTER